jgi:hypothetical protein
MAKNIYCFFTNYMLSCQVIIKIKRKNDSQSRMAQMKNLTGALECNFNFFMGEMKK